VSPLLDLTLDVTALALAVSTFLCLERMRRGPTIMDRILAFDTICVMLVGMMVVVSLRWQSSDYLDLILVFTLLGFFSTIAFSLYLHRTYGRHDPNEARVLLRRAKRQARAKAAPVSTKIPAEPASSGLSWRRKGP
jgi:multisubunit Na+/H+ antiporter MnhF subunit